MILRRSFARLLLIPLLCLGGGLFVHEASAQQEDACETLVQTHLGTLGHCATSMPGADYFSADEFLLEVPGVTDNGCPGSECWARRHNDACVSMGEIRGHSPAACSGSATCDGSAAPFGVTATCPNNTPENPTVNLCCGAVGGGEGSGAGGATPPPAPGNCISSTICSPLCRISNSAVTPAIVGESTRILAGNGNSSYGTQVAFTADGKSYVAVIEEHTNCDDGSNNCPHRGVSVFSCDPSQVGAAAGAGSASAGTGPAQRVVLPDPLGNVSFPRLAGGAIRAFSGVAGSVALLMFVYGGIMWILSGGEMSKVKMAQQILLNATIGLILIFGAYLFTSAIIESILANPS